MRFSETDIRIALIQNIFETLKKGEYKLAIEARYGFNYKRADVLVINECTHAYEIKSDLDELNKLNDQISNYRKNFDYVTVVTTNKFLKKVITSMPNYVGIMLFNETSLTLLRTPKKNKRLSKYHLAHNCSKEELLKKLPNLNKSINSSALIEHATSRLLIKDLREIQLKSFSQKFHKSTLEFIEEVSSPIRETDLLLLKRFDKIIIDEHVRIAS